MIDAPQFDTRSEDVPSGPRWPIGEPAAPRPPGERELAAVSLTDRQRQAGQSIQGVFDCISTW